MNPISKKFQEIKFKYPRFFEIMGRIFGVFVWFFFILFTFIQIYFNTQPFEQALSNTGDVVNTDLTQFFFQGQTIFYNPVLHKIFLNSFGIIFIASTIVAFIGTWALSQGRAIWEAFLLFLTLALPRVRREWGLVYDQESGKPLEFVIIRLYAVVVDERKFLNQSITDLDGRYRIYLPETYEKFIIEVSANGYVTTYKEVVQKGQGISFYAYEIGLFRTDTQVKKKLNIGEVKKTIQKPMTYLVFALSTIVTVHSTYGMLAIPQIDTFVFFFMYGGAWVWNVKVLRDRTKKIQGRVLSSKTKQPVAGVFLRLYKNDNQLVATEVTDNSGIANFKVEKGFYLLMAEREGSIQSEPFSVEVDARGHLNKNIIIDMSQSQLSSQTIPNPFS